jgi:16S rRNA processing protein RimM
MKFLPVGLVVAAHGVSGEVKFRYYNDGTGELDYPSFFVDAAGSYIELKPTRIRRQGNLFIIRFKGFDTTEKSGSLLKKQLFISEKDLAVLEEDEYYDYQLIGLKAVTDEDVFIGHVKDVMHIRSSDILVIEGAREFLVPLTDVHIEKISPGDGIIKIRGEALVE